MLEIKKPRPNLVTGVQTSVISNHRSNVLSDGDDMYIVTNFLSKSSKNPLNKCPVSPYGDKTFMFQTFEVEKLQDILLAAKMPNFLINSPFKDIGYKRLARTKEAFEGLQALKHTYIILDFDEVYSLEASEAIVKLFSTVKCFLIASRSYDLVKKDRNGVEHRCFNIKGVLAVDNFTNDEARIALQSIQMELDQRGISAKVDTTACSFNQVTAGSLKWKVLLDNDWCDNVFKISNIRNDVNPTPTIMPKVVAPATPTEKLIKLADAGDLAEFCRARFIEMGYHFIQSMPNGAIKVSHPSEVHSSGDYRWYYDNPTLLFHHNPAKSLNIRDMIYNDPKTRGLLTPTIDLANILKGDRSYQLKTVLHGNQITMSTKIMATVDAFFSSPDNSLLSVRAHMGAGKTVILREAIETAQNKGMHVLVITNRRTLAQDVKIKYGLKHYQHDCYQPGDSVVCQYDSLKNFDLDNFDMVVIDEFMSVMSYARNPMQTNNLCFTKFKQALSKRCVIADAFLTGYELAYFGFSKRTFIIENEGKDEATKAFIYESSKDLENKVLETVEQGPITISYTSAKGAQVMAKKLESLGKKVIMLTGDTSDEARERIYDMLSKPEAPYDAFIYTPCLTVGVSIRNEVSTHFHFDSRNTVDPISSLQMCKRSRAAKEIHMLVVSDINKDLPVEYGSVRELYLRNAVDNGDIPYFTVTDMGEIQLTSEGQLAARIDVFNNILNFNRKDAMLFLANLQFAQVELVSKSNSRAPSQLLASRRALNEETQAKQEKAIKFYQEADAYNKGCILAHVPVTKDVYLDQVTHQRTEEEREALYIASVRNKSFFKTCSYYNLFVGVATGAISVEKLKAMLCGALVKSNKTLRAICEYLLNHRACLNLGEFTKNTKNRAIFRLLGFVYNRRTKAYELNQDVARYSSLMQLNAIE